jgi:hypothetical protein
LLLAWATARAQDPAYTPILQAELSGVDVYSLSQQADGDILMTTDQGLMRYDGYTLRAYSNAAEKTKSLFGLSQALGKSWCFNLSGQFFSFRDDSLYLEYSLPDSLVSPAMAIAPLPNDDLVISCRRLLVLHPNRTTTLLRRNDNFEYGVAVIPQPDGGFVHISTYGRTAYHQKGDDSRAIPFAAGAVMNHHAASPNQLFQSAGHTYLRDGLSFDLFRLEAGRWRPLGLKSLEALQGRFPIRLYEDPFGGLWLPLNGRGLMRFDPTGNPQPAGKIFQEFALSCTLHDREGNLWLGTIGSGLLLLSNPDALNYRTVPARARDKNRFLTTYGRRLFLGFDAGDIVEIGPNGQQIPLYASQGEQLEYLHYDGFWDRMCFAIDGRPFGLDIASKQVHIAGGHWYPKGYQATADFLAVMPGTSGVYLVMPEGFDFPLEIRNLAGFWPLGPNLATIQGIARSRCAHYDGFSKQLYVGGAKGLMVVSDKGIKQVTYKGQSIIAKSILHEFGRIWVTSSQFGLVEVWGAEATRNFSTQHGLHSNEVHKMQRFGDHLYLSFDRVMQVLDPSNDRLRMLDQSDGLSGEQIKDFDFIDSTMWVAYDHSLRAIHLRGNPLDTLAPLIRFTGLTVNGKARPLAPGLRLAHDENQLDVSFVATDFRHRDGLRYRYKLEGVPNPEWKWLDLPLHAVSLSSLRPGHYTLMVKAVNSKGTSSKVIGITFRIVGPLWAQWWFIAGAAVLVLSLGFLLYRLQIRRIRRENALLLENERVAKALVDSNLTALRAQINPHFIFNALNSIQEFILTNERKQATKYLGKFADLMRVYLNHSRQNAVRLCDEVAALELYLELENLRFDDSLAIKVMVDPALNAEELQIPSLLIQPFVENAIKHGLFHQRRPGPRCLSVWFGAADEPGRLVCVIEDNGIGRAAAALLASNSPLHNSFATSATYDRLELLQRGGMTGLRLHFDDLLDADGQAAGTRVTLILPCL